MDRLKKIGKMLGKDLLYFAVGIVTAYYIHVFLFSI